MSWKVGRIKQQDSLSGREDLKIDQIISSCKEGDERGQKLLYDKYKDALFNLAYRITGSETEAEHILQDSFMDIFKSIDRFRAESGIYSWMRSIVVRKSTHFTRTNKWKWTSYEESAGENGVIPPPSTDGSELMETLQQLPKGFRTILILYYMENYSHEQISNELGINIGTSKSQLHRAKKRLKELILKKKKS
ncbi:MAG: RNA polymerase sigma factor [Saprospirales bacterium]|nr:MAG: RNA polymerase sigma factor [Saprospirales bacterium]